MRFGVSTAFALITEEFDKDVDAIRLLVKTFNDPWTGTPKARIAAANSATLLLAATFEEFVREMAQAYARAAVASVRSVRNLPPKLASAAWNRTMEMLAHNRINSGSKVMPAESMLDARTQFDAVYEFCNGDLSQNIYRALAHNENNMRPDEINSLFNVSRLESVCLRIADKEPLLQNFGEAEADKAHARLRDSLNEFFKRRNDIAHSLNAATSSSPDQILKDIDLFDAFGKSLCETLEASECEQGVRRVLTRSEGEEERCIVVKLDGRYAKVLHLIRDDTSRGRYAVNGKRWRPANPVNHWEKLDSSFEEVIELYKREEAWPSTAGGPILEPA